MKLTAGFRLARLRALIGDRREVRRVRAVRQASIIVGAVANWPAHGSFTGRTLDLSLKGLSVLVEAEHSARLRDIEGSTMSVVLALPTGTATLQAKIISLRPAEGSGYVVGGVVERIDSVSEQRLQEFLENPPML